MARDKPRLLLGLYARPKHPQSYHYAILIAPKITEKDHGFNKARHLPVSKYHVKNTIQVIDDQVAQPWRFERVSIPNLSQDPRLLACIVIGKVVSLNVADKILSQTPIYQVDDLDVERAGLFSCVTWVREAVDRLRRSGGVTRMPNWEIIQTEALGYVHRKKEEGRWAAGRVASGDHGIPVMDLLTGTELIS